jgi:tRNA A-37 threonylcarbamoyl transferase component Bud32
MDINQILEKYEDIIEDGEVSPEILTYVISKVGIIEKLSVKCSNQMSFVFVGEDLDNVYQYYINETLAKKIFLMINRLSRNKDVLYEFRDHKYKFNYFIHITPLIRYLPNNIIIWKKITPLNSIQQENLPQFVYKNFLRIVWDISKCLSGLHANGILHCDPTIDNIGIHKDSDGEERFVLYDFDGAREIKIGDDFKNDFYRLKKSIKFYYEIGNFPKKIIENLEIYFYNGLVIDNIINLILPKFDNNMEKTIEQIELSKIVY